MQQRHTGNLKIAVSAARFWHLTMPRVAAISNRQRSRLAQAARSGSVETANMNRERLANLLHDVRAGRKPVDAAVRQLKSLAIHNLDFARVDGHRSLRKGFPEVIYCEGKTPAQVVAIAKKILQHNDNLLATRADKETYRAVKRALSGKARYHEAARAI